MMPPLSKTHDTGEKTKLTLLMQSQIPEPTKKKEKKIAKMTRENPPKNQ